MGMTIDEAIKNAEKLAELNEDQARVYKEQDEIIGSWSYEECAKEHRQLADWLRELKKYRKQIQNLIDNESFEIVNPFNTYEYKRVVRVADLYDLMEVKADGTET